MYPSNVVVLRGRVTSDPVARELPSGSTVTQVELTTACDGAAVSVPVVVDERPQAAPGPCAQRNLSVKLHCSELLDCS